MNWLDLVEQTQHCQRNWDHNRTVDPATVDWLLDIGYTMPTKQNLDTVQIVAFQDRKQIEHIARSAVDSRLTWKKDLIQNPQMLAPVVFLYFKKMDQEETQRSLHERSEYKGGTTHIEIGLVAGAMALAANSVGMKTGFCRCFGVIEDAEADNPVVQLLKTQRLQNLGVDPRQLQLGLGVGYPLQDRPSHIDNNKGFHLQYIKNPATKIII